MIEKYFLHVWNKIYFNVDLPKDRDQPCNLTIDTALFDFFIPTTKRKKSVSQWLGSSNKEIEHFRGLDIAKAVFLIIMDALLYVPRLALNIIKLATEVLPLTLRELAYAAFNSMVEGAEETTGIASGLYKIAASICWLFTSLFSLIYLIGGLVTSPGMTILSIMDTLDKIKCPALLNLAICAFIGLSIFASQLAIIIIFAPMLLPLSVLTVPERFVSGWVWGALIGVFLFDLNGGLMFNNDPDDNSLFFTTKTASLSIHPLEFLRIMSEKLYQDTIRSITVNDVNSIPTPPPVFESEAAKEAWAQEQYDYFKKIKDQHPFFAWRYCKLAADHGHVLAQFEHGDDCYALFQMRLSGETAAEREKCRQKAMHYYELAAKQGHAGAGFKLGNLYAVNKNFDMAERWYKSAATQKYPGAKLMLANLRFEVAIKEKDGSKIERVMSSCNSAIEGRAGEQEEAWKALRAQCQHQLGVSYQIGLFGKTQDLKKAAPLLTAAAEQSKTFKPVLRSLIRQVLL